MKENPKKIILNSIAIFFLITVTVSIIWNFQKGFIANIFWVCYLGMILITIGSLTKNSRLISSQLNIIFVPLVFWTIDYFFFLFTGEGVFNLTGFLFEATQPLFWKIFSIYHFFILPLAFISLYLVGLKEKDNWKITVFEMIALFIAVRLLTSSQYNLNCMFSSCLSFVPNEPFWPLNWFLIVLGLSLTINYFIVKLFYKKD